MSEEKATKHNLLVRILSESPITYDQALFQLAKAIDKDQLEDNDLILIGFDFDEHGTHSPNQTDRKSSKAAQKIKDIASRSPGALGDLYAFMKGYKWHQIYIGFAAVVLIGTLLFKWVIRLITGNF